MRCIYIPSQGIVCERGHIHNDCMWFHGLVILSFGSVRDNSSLVVVAVVLENSGLILLFRSIQVCSLSPSLVFGFLRSVQPLLRFGRASNSYVLSWCVGRCFSLFLLSDPGWLRFHSKTRIFLQFLWFVCNKLLQIMNKWFSVVLIEVPELKSSEILIFLQ